MLGKIRKIIKNRFGEFSEDALDTLFPLNEVCMYCNKRVLTDKHYLCSECYENLKPIKHNYLIPVYSIKNPTELISAYEYDEVSGKAMYDYKENRKRGISYAFSSMLIDRLESNFDMNIIDVVVPVPSTDKKIKYRGFDHVADISKKIADYFEIPHLFLLERLHHNADQKDLNRVERLNNVIEAFSAKKNLKKIKNMPIRILLVDDIVTTGATIASAIAELEAQEYCVYGASVFRKI